MRDKGLNKARGSGVPTGKMKTLVSAFLLLVPSLLAAPLPPAEELASNTVAAIYETIVNLPCYHRTVDCPDKCDHGQRFARFRVVENEAYSRPGEYGDDKLEPGQAFAVDMKNDVEGQQPAVKELVQALNPGDAVRLTIRHYYVKSEQAHYPVRPVTFIERIETPTQLPAPRESPLDHVGGVMPIAH